MVCFKVMVAIDLYQRRMAEEHAASGASAGAAILTVKFYFNRNLDVVSNLTKLFKDHHDYYFWDTAHDYLDFCKEYVPEIKPYQEEIEKLLLLQ